MKFWSVSHSELCRKTGANSAHCRSLSRGCARLTAFPVTLVLASTWTISRIGSWRVVTSDNRISQHSSGDPFRASAKPDFRLYEPAGQEGRLAGKAGGLLYGGALIAVARGVAGGEDEPLVAIQFAEEGMRHEIETQLLGIGRSSGEFDGALAGGVEFV